jgi:hypothetical protein
MFKTKSMLNLLVFVGTDFFSKPHTIREYIDKNNQVISWKIIK